MSKPRELDALPITIDDEDRLVDDRVKAYAERVGIAEIKKPVANASPAQTAPDVPLHVTVPEYVLRALRVKAAGEGVSARYLVLKALSDNATVEIRDGDLIGDRRAAKKAQR
jgi:hypothetical protein